MLRLYGWIEQERRADSTGVMSSLLLEIVNVYPALHPPSLTAHASNRVCNALALLQCVASHSETRSLFLNGMSKLSKCLVYPPPCLSVARRTLTICPQMQRERLGFCAVPQVRRAASMRGGVSWRTSTTELTCSAYPPLSISFPEYNKQDTAIRVFASNIVGCDWCPGQGMSPPLALHLCLDPASPIPAFLGTYGPSTIPYSTRRS